MLASKRRVTARGLLWTAATVTLFTLLVVSTAGLVLDDYWISDNFNHFRWYYLLVSVPLLVAGLAGRRWLFCAGCAVPLLINGYCVAPQYLGSAAPPASGESLRLVHFNVHRRNANRAEILRWVTSLDADIIFIQELGLGWSEVLEAVEAPYRVVVAIPQPDSFGVAVLTRVPLESVEVLRHDDFRIPTVRAVARLGGEPVTVYATHPLPPMEQGWFLRRNRHLQALSQDILQRETPVVLVGDLNLTPWSGAFGALLDRAGLIDASRGRGYQTTWPSWLPVGVPIDHSLHSSELTTVDRWIGPALASDHLPVVVTLARAR